MLESVTDESVRVASPKKHLAQNGKSSGSNRSGRSELSRLSASATWRTVPIHDIISDTNGLPDISLTSPSSSSTTSSHQTPPQPYVRIPSPAQNAVAPSMSMLSSSSSSSTSAADSNKSQVHAAPKVVSPLSNPLRTLMDVQRQVAAETAIRGVTKAKTIDGVKIGVVITLGKHDEEPYLHEVASNIMHRLLLNGEYLFAVTTQSSASSSNGREPQSNYMIILGSYEDLAQRAAVLASSKFLDRVESVHNSGRTWTAYVRDRGTMTYDEAALWDILRKASRKPMNPLTPPPGSRGIDEMLGIARTKILRITPMQAYEELHDTDSPWPVFLVDIRPIAQRAAFGGIHGSLVIERNVLEWRFDPRCEARLPIANRYDLRVIVFCQEGYTSSLAAVALQELGLLNATDIIGGYKAWSDAGLPAQIAARQPGSNRSEALNLSL